VVTPCVHKELISVKLVQEKFVIFREIKTENKIVAKKNFIYIIGFNAIVLFKNVGLDLK